MTSRWRLNRAGILNVYQYGNETLQFVGGRLLLRTAVVVASTNAATLAIARTVCQRFQGLS